MKKFRRYLESKMLSKMTQYGILKRVEKFFNWIEVEDVQVTKPDVLKYLEHLKNRGLQNVSRKHHLTALSHYFTYLYINDTITESPCWFLKIQGTNKKKLYKIYTPEELDQLFDNYYQFFVRGYDDSRQRHSRQKERSALTRERNAVILSILINQGATTTEIERIELGDVDLMKATIKISGGRKHNDRTLPLKAYQIGLFMNYLKEIRPQIVEHRTTENDKLFMAMPTGKKDGDLTFIFDRLTPKIKLIDKQFTNYMQIRASVITHWLKTYGLRKAQYMAGHRNISTTEQFLPNNLENLTDDINKMHPF